jgi:hypothetical protein
VGARGRRTVGGGAECYTAWGVHREKKSVEKTGVRKKKKM